MFISYTAQSFNRITELWSQNHGKFRIDKTGRGNCDFWFKKNLCYVHNSHKRYTDETNRIY